MRRLPAETERLQGSRPRGSHSVRHRQSGRFMTYTVKEIFYTLQGEGAQAGRAAVFCRFSGCNLWSGREEDRSRAVCKFCDTDFVGTGPEGGRFKSAAELADAIDRCWQGETFAQADRSTVKKYVVCT